MFYHPPKLAYNGLTIILGESSRFDTDKLISGRVGDWFDKILTPFSRLNCDIRLAAEPSPLIDGTKLLLLLGQKALDRYITGYSLLTYRGSPIELPNGLLAIPTISPQDTFDRKNYENPEDEESDAEKGEEKDSQKTKRKNFKFWFYSDIRKTIRTLESGTTKYPRVEFKYSPQPQTLISKLEEWKEGFLCVDIETDPAQNVTVFSILFSESNVLDYSKTYEVFVIPFKRYDNSVLYTALDYCHIFRALTFAFRRNTVVGHNLSFDLFVLLFKYFINPPVKIFDTMIAHHRCHPEIEKSLAHVISYYTDLVYHKDEGVFNPRNFDQEQKLWSYNGKDVWTTWLVFCAQQEEISKLGTRSSVEQGCGTIRSILAMQYEGCYADKDKMCKIVDGSDAKFEQIKRLIKLFTGRNINPRSVDNVSDYLYKTLKLPKLATKKKAKERKDGKDLGPTGEDVLLKLLLKTNLPSIRLILEGRKIAKQASSLREVRLWRGDRLTCAYKLTTETFRLKSSELLSFNAPKECL
jgi:hypothetical protein